MLYHHQDSFHNLDASSAENTEWHDKKPSANQWTKENLTDICLWWPLMKMKFYSKTDRGRSCQKKKKKKYKNMSFSEIIEAK